MNLFDYFGLISAISFFSSIFYALRRRTIRQSLTRQIGVAVTWRNAHIYLGLVFAITFLIHTKFVLPIGTFSWWLYILSWWTIITGALGWFLQKWIPKKITASTQTEIIFERIPNLCDHLRSQCENIAETCPAILADFYNRIAKNFMASAMLISPIGAVQIRLDMLSQLDAIRSRLPDDRRNEVDQISDCIKAKFDLDAHYTMQMILRLWIYLHAPASFILAILIAFHIFAVIYY